MALTSRWAWSRVASSWRLLASTPDGAGAAISAKPAPAPERRVPATSKGRRRRPVDGGAVWSRDWPPETREALARYRWMRWLSLLKVMRCLDSRSSSRPAPPGPKAPRGRAAALEALLTGAAGRSDAPCPVARCAGPAIAPHLPPSLAAHARLANVNGATAGVPRRLSGVAGARCGWPPPNCSTRPDPSGSMPREVGRSGRRCDRPIPAPPRRAPRCRCRQPRAKRWRLPCRPCRRSRRDRNAPTDDRPPRRWRILASSGVTTV